MRNFLFLVIFFLSLVTIGQQTIDNGADPEGKSLLSPYGTTMIIRNTNTSANIKGHQYYEEYNGLATVYINAKRVRKCLVRYNAFNDEIEVTENQKVFNLLKVNHMEVVLDDYSYKVFDYKGNKHFFIMLNKGRYSLAIKKDKKIKGGRQADSGYQTNIPSRYIEINKYFIIDNDTGEIKSLKLKKKEVLNLLHKKEEIQKMASSKKLNFRKEKDVITILDYYNSI